MAERKTGVIRGSGRDACGNTNRTPWFQFGNQYEAQGVTDRASYHTMARDVTAKGVGSGVVFGH
jgi:hypothetical protein